LNRFLDETLHRFAREGARKLLRPIVLGLSACLFGAAGIGFLLAWVFLTLSAVWGPAMAALALGVGLTLLAGLLLAVAMRPLSKPDTAAAPTPRSPAPKDAERDGASLVAFTAAFVLGKYLTGNRRG
jgi:Na+-transporting methylmalonyl-CoA/oxaloacetate decarboxylase gamma subunit